MSSFAGRHTSEGWVLAAPYPMGTFTRRALRGLIRALCPPAPAPQLVDLEDRIEDHLRRLLRYPDYARERLFDADVVVVGTGAGGAVAGAELAEAGLDVVFVEEGAYHATSSFSPFATDAIPRLYRDGSSTMIFGRPNIPYLE